MAALICGSIAFDNIMVFEDSFKNHILPDKIHILNISFLVPQMRREFGGCAGNISYNLKLLGGDPLPMATVGSDFTPYAEHFDDLGIRRDHVRIIGDAFTAQAFITTDRDDNQITAFHPGAMSSSAQNEVADADGVSIGIVSADSREGMMSHAVQFADAGIPFVFDPGQGLPLFNGNEFRQFIEQATWVAVNDYEWQLLKDRTGWGIAQLKERVEALIVTRGGEGSLIYVGDEEFEIPAVNPREISDPTGCGDAYRAGLLFGIMKQYDWKTIGRIASLMGAIKIECHGTQNHDFSRDEFHNRYRESFGEALTE